MTHTPESRRLKELVALLVFLVVAVPFAMPSLSAEGAIRGRYSSAVVFLVLCRLGWNVYKGTFRFKDYFVYLGIVVGFCVWAEFQCGR